MDFSFSTGGNLEMWDLDINLARVRNGVRTIFSICSRDKGINVQHLIYIYIYIDWKIGTWIKPKQRCTKVRADVVLKITPD